MTALTVLTCESCGMPMRHESDHGPGRPDSAYCAYCSTPDGDAQGFEERLRRLTQWAMRQDGLDRAAAERAARDYMRALPAWRDHPALR